MSKKIIGAVLVMAGLGLMVSILMKGVLFPHLIGPVVLISGGIALLSGKRSGDKSNMNIKRIVMILAVVAVVVIAGGLLSKLLPSVMQKIVDMHSGV